MEDEIRLVLSYKNPYWMDNDIYIEYYVELKRLYLMDLLKVRGFLSKEEIYKEFGFEFGNRLTMLYLYDQEAEYLYELSCSKIECEVKPGFTFDAGKIYLIKIKMKGE